MFAEIIGKLLFWCGEDKIIYGSEAPIFHPQWALRAFMDFQIPEDLRAGYGYPQLTDQAKRKILGRPAPPARNGRRRNQSQARPAPITCDYLLLAWKAPWRIHERAARHAGGRRRDVRAQTGQAVVELAFLTSSAPLSRALGDPVGAGTRPRSSRAASRPRCSRSPVKRERWCSAGRRPGRCCPGPMTWGESPVGALTATSVPVPVILLEDTGELIGVPFYVMEKVDGYVVGDTLPAGFAESAKDRRGIADVLVDAWPTCMPSIPARWACSISASGRLGERQVRRWSAALILPRSAGMWPPSTNLPAACGPGRRPVRAAVASAELLPAEAIVDVSGRCALYRGGARLGARDAW